MSKMNYGGQAVIDGVMMRGLTRATVATLGAALADAHDGPALILIGPLMEGI